MTGTTADRRPVRIANCSGYFGDRLSAAREMVDGGPIDVLTGDWLAELTMLILARQRMKHGAGAGYARTFLTQMQQVLADCLERGIRVVTNAGGLDPAGLADALANQCQEAGLQPRIAVVTGDDLSERMDTLTGSGAEFRNLDTGETLAEAGVQPLTANAYLGGRGITAALDAGADIVITGRVTDAALVIGPAAWWHGWDYTDAEHLDPLAGALVAGHVIECGAQATGGNYSFFEDVPDLRHVGFPIAEVAADGRSVITKHPGTDGMVSVGTVTAQLLYEIGPPHYLNPDVTADFGSIRLEQVGRDRVRISGVRGLPPPDRLKVSMNLLGGFRNSATLVLTGLDVAEKADVALQAAFGLRLSDIDAQPEELARRSDLPVDQLTIRFVHTGREDPATYDQAQSQLVITAKAMDPKAVGKAFTAPIVESALASYPGMFPTAPPGPGTPFGVFWPTTVPADAVSQTVTIDGTDVAELPAASPLAAAAESAAVTDGSAPHIPSDGPTEPVPLGALVGARSGDKGGNANVGLWVPDPIEPEAVALADEMADALVTRIPVEKDDVAQLWETDHVIGAPDSSRADASYRWLLTLLSDPDQVRDIFAEFADLPVDIHPLPNLRAVNLVIHGLLGRGVAENTSPDPQAKGLGELLRARIVDVPAELLPSHSEPWEQQ